MLMSPGRSIATSSCTTRNTTERSLSLKVVSLAVPVGHSTSARASGPSSIAAPAQVGCMGTPSR
jgi:hypothetical protein